MAILWMRNGFIVAVVTLLLSACNFFAGGPDLEVKGLFEDWAFQASVPYKNVTYQIIRNDDAFATVRVQASLKESATEDWKEKQVDFECRHIGSQWKCSSGFAFILTEAELLRQEQIASGIATADAFSFQATASETHDNANRSVLVEVWDDFQSPAGRGYSQTVEPLLFQNYVALGKIRYEYRHFPFLDDRSDMKESDQAANASMCALEQGKFWEYHDYLFAKWNGENRGTFADERLLAFAEDLGLDITKFHDCFTQNRYKAIIDKDLADGKKAGVKGTPSVFVNGTIVAIGYVPTYEEIARAIDAALASSGQ